MPAVACVVGLEGLPDPTSCSVGRTSLCLLHRTGLCLPLVPEGAVLCHLRGSTSSPLGSEHSRDAAVDKSVDKS